MVNIMITKDSVVEFHYKVTDAEGNLIDQSGEGEPLKYLHGYNNIVPGLESQLQDKETGAKFEAKVPADLAYGEKNDALVQQVPAAMFQGVENVEIGMGFSAQTPQGPVEVTVVAVEDEMVTVDGNHPLAGKDLTFDVEVVSVREATAEELEHGHAH